MAAPASEQTHQHTDTVTPASSGKAQSPPPAQSVTQLFRHLVDDAAILMRKELALAASEISRSVDGAKRGVSGLATGAAVLHVGLIFLLGAAAIGLTQWMEPWAAVLVIGVAATVVGAIMMASGKSKLSAENLVPEHAVASVQKDSEAVRRHTP